MSIIEDLVIASRTCAEHGVIDAYGHVSVRSDRDRDRDRYFMARAIAPELITEDDILEFDLDSNPVIAGGPAGYNERYIHGEIYKLRPEINAIVHNHSHSVVPFSCTPCQLRPIFHMSAFIGLGIPNWDIREAQMGTDMLVRNSFLGESLARKLGKHPAALMRGHGSVVVGEKIQIAVGRTVYLDHNAKMQFQAMMMAGGTDNVVYMDDSEVAANVVWQEYVRSWDLWKKKWQPRLAAEKAAKAQRPR
ncbi:MAG TPA: class II aldolase/adducin family protein [Usitatibacteraceae bacterium]